MVSENTPWKKTYRKINGEIRLVAIRKINGKYQIKILDNPKQYDPERKRYSIEEKENDPEFVKLENPDIKQGKIDEQTINYIYDVNEKAMYDRIKAFKSKLPSDIRAAGDQGDYGDKGYAPWFTSYESFKDHVMVSIASNIENGDIDYKLSQFSKPHQKELRKYISKKKLAEIDKNE